MYLQESGSKLGVENDPEMFSQAGVENDPEMFSQAINSSNSELWDNAMKDELDSMANKGVWELVELPNGVKAVSCKWSFKTKKDSLGNIE